MATDGVTCGCNPSARCPEANAMWEAANAVYRSRDHDAWLKALEPYNEHRAVVQESQGDK